MATTRSTQIFRSTFILRWQYGSNYFLCVSLPSGLSLLWYKIPIKVQKISYFFCRHFGLDFGRHFGILPYFQNGITF